MCSITECCNRFQSKPEAVRAEAFSAVEHLRINKTMQNFGAGATNLFLYKTHHPRRLILTQF